MYKIVSLLLLIAGVALAAMGFTTYEEATAGVSILGLDLSVSDQEAKKIALIYMGGAAICVLAAFVFFRKS